MLEKVKQTKIKRETISFNVFLNLKKITFNTDSAYVNINIFST